MDWTGEMKVSFNGNIYSCKVWKIEDGCIGPAAFDTETTLIVSNETPSFIIGSAFNGTTVYFIKKNSLREFFKLHFGAVLFMANAPFDLAVIEKAAGICPFQLIETEKLIDVQLLAQLVSLAETGDTLPKVSLDYLTYKYLGIELSKDGIDSGGNQIRSSFGRFLLADGSVQYESIPFGYLQYAARDSIATFKLAYLIKEKVINVSNCFSVSPGSLLSHLIQLKGSYSLHLVSQAGLTIDSSYRKIIQSDIKEKELKHLEILKGYGWCPGEGSAGSLQRILEKININYHLNIPRTKTGKLSSSAESLKIHQNIPFIREYLSFTKNRKLLEFLNISDQIIHPRFNPIVSTGRTSCSSPNVQNFPRDDRIRSIICASPGHVLLAVDYSQIELRALAQITFTKYGYSKMKDLLNTGCDLHSYFASVITGLPESEISNEDRRKAKACNFGFPGGLGLMSFVEYAKTNYNVELSCEQAHHHFEKWLETFPEVKFYLHKEDEIYCLIQSGDLLKSDSSLLNRVPIERLAWIFKGIISGNTKTVATNREYTEDEIDWAFNLVKRLEFPSKSRLLMQISFKKGSHLLWKNFVRRYNSIKFESGRVRAFTDYCQSKNNPFQGLAADGAKEALYELVKARYRVVNFIHDEYLIELPIESDLRESQHKVKQILISSMKKFCPDLEISVESQWMINWRKNGTHYLSDEGLLVEIQNSSLPASE